MLAHGMCATCYSLRRQDEEDFGVSERLCWSGTAIAVVCEMRLERGSAAWSFTTGFLAVLS
jgi:hypothetical protein